jgi:hypothetical protein
MQTLRSLNSRLPCADWMLYPRFEDTHAAAIVDATPEKLRQLTQEQTCRVSLDDLRRFDELADSCEHDDDDLVDTDTEKRVESTLYASCGRDTLQL